MHCPRFSNRFHQLEDPCEVESEKTDRSKKHTRSNSTLLANFHFKQHEAHSAANNQPAENTRLDFTADEDKNSKN